MHFHAVEDLVHGDTHHLGGVTSIAYPSDKPAFGTVGEAIDAVMDSAHLRWGDAAEDAVELALLAAIVDHDELTDPGATATWSASSTEGATWSVQACDCADGALAQMFAHHRGT